MQEPITVQELSGVRPSLVQLTHVIYALHACVRENEINGAGWTG